MGKDNVVMYTMGCYSVMRKGNPTIWDKWMDLETIMLSEVSQTKKDKYYMISLRCEIYNTELIAPGSRL